MSFWESSNVLEHKSKLFTYWIRVESLGNLTSFKLAFNIWGKIGGTFCISLGHYSPRKLTIFSGEGKEILTVFFSWNAEKGIHKFITENSWQSIGIAGGGYFIF